MKKKGMTGPMALWCDTSQPAPVRMKRPEYLEPTSTKLVEKILKQLMEEERRKYHSDVEKAILRSRQEEAIKKATK